MASTACASSGPSASTVSTLPCPAASIITPMIDFAFTRRSLFEIQTSAK
jgi:hypothetical protein